MIVCDNSFLVIDLVTDENDIDAQLNASAAGPLSPDFWWKIVKKFQFVNQVVTLDRLSQCKTHLDMAILRRGKYQFNAFVRSTHLALLTSWYLEISHEVDSQTNQSTSEPTPEIRETEANSRIYFRGYIG